MILLPDLTDPRGGAAFGEAEADDMIPLDAPGAPGIAPANYTFNATFTNVAPAPGRQDRQRHRHRRDRQRLPSSDAARGAGPPDIARPEPGPWRHRTAGHRRPQHQHGTFVAGMAAANIAFCFGVGNRFVVVAEHYAAATVSPQCTATSRLIPMIGSAPGATIFPIKVFAAGSLSTPTSRTIAAMEAAIDLRQKFDAGEPEGSTSRWRTSASAGRPTPRRARCRTRQSRRCSMPISCRRSRQATRASRRSPSVRPARRSRPSPWAAQRRRSTSRYIRAQFTQECFNAPLATVLACAKAWRPDMNVQISEFSSRGPTHDGRINPDVVANGSFNFSQGSGTSPGTVSFGSGTSYSTPTVAGVAAVLREAVPAATAKQVRNAIILGADGDRYRPRA